MVTYAKISPKKVNPRDIAATQKKKKKEGRKEGSEFTNFSFPLTLMTIKKGKGL